MNNVRPFDMPSADVLFASKRKTYAHYFPAFPLSLDNQPAATDYYNRNYLNPNGENGKHVAYGGWTRARPLDTGAPLDATAYTLLNAQTEVHSAINGGITAFAFDMLNYADALLPNGRLQTLMMGAAMLDFRFKVAPIFDMGALLTVTTGQIVTLMQFLTASATLSPVLDRTPDGRIVISAFNAGLRTEAWWAGLIAALNAVDIDVYFVPVLLGATADAGLFDPITGEVANWGTAIPSAATDLVNIAAAAHKAGFAYMLPVIPQQFRPKSQKFWECSNSVAFRDAWAAAIASQCEAVQVVTWSDFSESAQVQPYTDSTLAPNIGTGFYDLNAFFSAWYLTGAQPLIVRDVLYWFYRKNKTTDPHPAQALSFTPVSSTAEDNIECVAFLTAPGEVLINGVGFAAPAGISSYKVPSAPGNPIFALQRNGSDVFRFTAPVTIGPLANGTLDLTYWSGSGTRH